MNKLYFGDNLQIMHEMENNFVDLIATDPPSTADATITLSLANQRHRARYYRYLAMGRCCRTRRYIQTCKSKRHLQDTGHLSQRIRSRAAKRSQLNEG